MRDMLTIQVLKPEAFQSEESGVFLEEDYSLETSIPKQLPEGKSADKIASQVKSTSNAAVVILVIVITIQFLLKSSLEKIMDLYLDM